MFQLKHVASVAVTTSTVEFINISLQLLPLMLLILLTDYSTTDYWGGGPGRGRHLTSQVGGTTKEQLLKGT